MLFLALVSSFSFGDLLIALEEFLQLGGHYVLERLFRLGVTELGLGLTLELNVLHLDRQYGGKSLAVVVADKVLVLFFQ